MRTLRSDQPRRRNTEPERQELVYYRLDEIHPYPNNPRQNDKAVASLKYSITEFGFNQPIVIDANNIIVCGHTRYKALQELGMSEAMCIKLENLTENQIRMYRIADNKIAEASSWDNPALSVEVTALLEAGVNVDQFEMLNFPREEVDCLTETVNSDCLDDSGLDEMARDVPPDDGERHIPTTTRFVLGDCVFFTTREVYDNWIAQLRMDFDFEEEAIVEELKRRIGLGD